MKNLVDKLHIEPRREYSLEEVADFKFVPWAKNYRTLLMVIVEGRLGWDPKQTRTIPGKRNQYFIRGSTIIKYLKNYGPILMDTVYKNHGKPNTKSEDRNPGKGKTR